MSAHAALHVEAIPESEYVQIAQSMICFLCFLNFPCDEIISHEIKRWIPVFAKIHQLRFSY